MQKRVWAILLLCFAVFGVALAQGSVRAVVVNEFSNIRTVPAIGAPVIDTVSAGFEFNVITARSADSQWLRVDYLGNEGWVNVVPLVILSGNVDALPVADPRTIPYGGFDAPRSGPSSATSPVTGRTTSGLRLRAGPSTAYPTLVSIPNDAGVILTGRTLSNGWYQINFDGLLGWSAASFIQIIGLPGIEVLPIDGVIADAPPSSGEVAQDFEDLIRLMLDRVIRAQDALNQVRTLWTDAALTGRAACTTAFPPRPSDISITLPLLSAFFQTLEPLRIDFNDAMFNVRSAIDLYIEVCRQPGSGNPVGQATVQGALNTVNLAEAQLISLRTRLENLIPDTQIGVDQCVLEFNNQREVLPVLSVGVIYLDEFNSRKTIIGFCIDVVANQRLSFQVLPLPGSNIEPFISVSPLADPTNFFFASRGTLGELYSVGPLVVTETTRFVVIISDLSVDGTPPSGDFAFYVADVTFSNAIPQLIFDEATGSVILQTPQQQGQTPTDQTPGGGGQTPPGGGGTVVCPSTAFTCNQLFTCAEAQACFNAGNFSLDEDGDGIPCEGILCPSG